METTPITTSDQSNKYGSVSIPLTIVKTDVVTPVASNQTLDAPPVNIPTLDTNQKQENAQIITAAGLLDQTKDLIRLFIELKDAASIRSKIYSYIGGLIMIVTSVASLLGTSWLTDKSTYLCLIITIVTQLGVILKINDRSFNFKHIVIDCNICINRLTGLVSEINSGVSVHNYDTFNKTLSVYKDRYNQDSGIEIDTVDLAANAKAFTLQPLTAISTI